MIYSEIIRIGFLIFPGFPMACLTSMIEPLRAAGEIAGQRRFDWMLISETGDKVASSAGVIFDPDTALHDKPQVDILILLSSPASEFSKPSASNGILRAMASKGAVLGGVSGGVFPLTRAGVMAGFRCSVHWCYEAAFRAEFPDIVAEGDVIVTDRRRYTASGAAAAFDLALGLIETQLGEDVAHETACWFQHPMIRGEGIRQKVPLVPDGNAELPKLVRNAVSLFAQRIDDPISIAEVADALGVTARQVERAFKKATGENPTQYYRTLRMKAARQLVLYSNDTTPQIAAAVGYNSTTPLLRHYRTAFGVDPHTDRARINAFRVSGNMPVPSV